MNAQLNHTIARQRSAELHRPGKHARIASEVSATRPNSRERGVGETRFTLHGRHIAKLDRFIAQAERAARRAKREFEGICLELDGQGTVSVHATGMTSILL